MKSAVKFLLFISILSVSYDSHASRVMSEPDCLIKAEVIRSFASWGYDVRITNTFSSNNHCDRTYKVWQVFRVWEIEQKGVVYNTQNIQQYTTWDTLSWGINFIWDENWISYMLNDIVNEKLIFEQIEQNKLLAYEKILKPKIQSYIEVSTRERLEQVLQKVNQFLSESYNSNTIKRTTVLLVIKQRVEGELENK